MAYNCYQVQMANAWKERCDKEAFTTEKFWTEQALGNSQELKAGSVAKWDTGSVAGSKVSSAAPSGYTSKTSFLKSKLEHLENELNREREQRKKVESDLETMKRGSRPGTPKSQAQ
eukprot:gene16645-22895_t